MEIEKQLGELSGVLDTVSTNLNASREDNAELAKRVEEIEKASKTLASAEGVETLKTELSDINDIVTGLALAGNDMNSDENAMTEFGEMLTGKREFALNAENEAVVPANIATTILQERNARSQMRQLIPAITSSVSNYSEPQNKGGINAYHVTNGSEGDRAESAKNDVVLESATWSLLASFPQTSKRLLAESPFNIASVIKNKMVEGFARMEDQDILRGTGAANSGQMKGLLNFDTVAAGSWAYGKVQKVTGTFDAQMLIDMELSLDSAYLANAAYFVSRDAYSKLYAMVLAGGANPVVQLVNGKMEVLGYPVMKNTILDAAVAGSTPIMFGEIGRAAQIIDAPTITLDTDVTPTKPNMTAFYVETSTGLLKRDTKALVFGEIA